MPAIMPDDHFGIAFDMHGCPNRCRHCWIGPRPGRGRITEDDLRWVVSQFRAFMRDHAGRLPFHRLWVSTWAREPDFSPDYRRLHALERELSDDPPSRGEYHVLSVWRLARDPDYAPWAYEVGLRLSQIPFFGLEAVSDWAHRRQGAFRDALAATERLLAAGIRVRWKWYFTKRIIPDLPGLIELTQELRLRQRCEALGGPFELWFLPISPDGDAWQLEHLRPTRADLERVPRCLLEQVEERTGEPIGVPEQKLLSSLLADDGPAFRSLTEFVDPPRIWFHVTPGLDVYLLMFETTPAFRLGNLRTDGMAAIVERYQRDATPGLQSLFHVPVSELARRFGRPHGQRLYKLDDLKTRLAKMRVEAESGAPPGGPG